MVIPRIRDSFYKGVAITLVSAIILILRLEEIYIQKEVGLMTPHLFMQIVIIIMAALNISNLILRLVIQKYLQHTVYRMIILSTGIIPKTLKQDPVVCCLQVLTSEALLIIPILYQQERASL